MSNLENKVQQKRKMLNIRRKLKEKRVAKDRLTFLKAWYPAVKKKNILRNYREILLAVNLQRAIIVSTIWSHEVRHKPVQYDVNRFTS